MDNWCSKPYRLPFGSSKHFDLLPPMYMEGQPVLRRGTVYRKTADEIEEEEAAGSPYLPSTARGKESRVPNITFFPTFLLSLLPSPTEHARLCSSFRVNCFGSCGPDCTCHSFLSRSEPDLIGFSAPASPSPWTTLSWMMIFLTSRAMLEAPILSQNLRRYACPIRAGKG